MTAAILLMVAVAIESPDARELSLRRWLRYLTAIMRPHLGRALRLPSGITGASFTLRKHGPDLRKEWTQLTGANLAVRAKSIAHKGPAAWGRVYWQGLHDVSALYVSRNASAGLCFIKLLPCVLPCQTCRRHIPDKLRDTLDIREAAAASGSRRRWMNYVIIVHNRVTRDVKDIGAGVEYPLLLKEPRSTAAALRLVRNHAASGRTGISNAVKGSGDNDCGCEVPAELLPTAAAPLTQTPV